MSIINEFVEKLRDRLKKELQLADEDKRKANVLQFDRAVGYANGMAIAIDILNQLAEEYKDVSDANVGKWISVSEKLPEYNKYSVYYESVIVTLDDGRVVDGCYRNKDKEWWVDAADGEHYSIDATGHVIAWMPLPEPYKGE